MSAPPQTPPSTPPPPRLHGTPLALAGLLLALLLAHHPVVRSGFTAAHGDEGDARLVHLVLEHGFRHLRGDALHARFWDPPFFHPAPNTAAYTETLLGVLPLYAPWRAAGAGEDAAYLLWLFSVTAGNFLAARWLLARGFGARPLGAAAGAVLFAAGASRLNQANHPQLLAHFWAVLAVGALLRLGREGTGRREGAGWAALLVGACVAQLYAGFYWGWFLGFLLLLALLAALASRTARPLLLARLRTHGAALALCGALGLLALWPLVSHALAAVREVGLREWGDVSYMVPRFHTWFHVGGEHWVWGRTAQARGFLRLPTESEHRAGLGYLTAALAGWGLWGGRRRPAVALLLAVTLLAVGLCTTYRGGWTPWWLVFHGVPGASAVRAVARIGVWLLLPAAVGLALWVSRQQGRGRGALGALAAGLCLLEQGVSGGHFPLAEPRADVAQLAARVREARTREGCASFLYAPTRGAFPSYKYQLDAMWAAVEAGVPTVNGYSGNEPPGWELEDLRDPSGAPAAGLEAALGRWGRARGLREGDVCLLAVPARR
jgi:hypothetical protein